MALALTQWARARRPHPPGAHPRLPGPLRTAVGGIDRVTRDPQLRLLIGLTAAQCFVRGCLNVLVVIAAFNLFHAGSSGVGYLNAALGVGGLVGAFVGTSLETKRMARSFGVAVAFWGAPIALLAPLSWLGPALLCLVVVGVANGVEDVGLVTLLQRACPYEMLSSVLGVLWGLAMAAVALGSIVAPKIDAGVGARAALGDRGGHSASARAPLQPEAAAGLTRCCDRSKGSTWSRRSPCSAPFRWRSRSGWPPH